jgi:hypothetical protein
MSGDYSVGPNVGMPERVGDWPLTRLQQHGGKTGGQLIKHARYDCRRQRNEAETLKEADSVKKEVAGGVVVKIYSAAVGARACPTPMALATVRPGKPPCPGRTVGQDAAPVIFATRRITPESTVTPVREMVWK